MFEIDLVTYLGSFKPVKCEMYQVIQINHTITVVIDTWFGLSIVPKPPVNPTK